MSEAHKSITTIIMADAKTKKPRGRPPKKVDANTVGGRLQSLRLERGLSQDDLADILGISRPMISKYEDNTHPMSPEALKRAAEKFGVTPSHILFGEEIIYAEHTVPLAGIVGAGAPIDAIEDTDPSAIPVPSDFAGTVAFRVRGESCLPVFEPGDILVVQRDSAASESDFLGRFCVVETGGNGYVKEVRKSIGIPGQAPRYDLISPNDKTIKARELQSVRPVLLRILGKAR